MSRLVVVHPDGRRVAVTEDAYERRFRALGFTVEGELRPASFGGALGDPSPGEDDEELAEPQSEAPPAPRPRRRRKAVPHAE